MLSVPTMIINAQAYPSGYIPVSNNSTSSINQSTQIGICVVGAGGPCNGNTNSAK
jgi:type II secretory pathway component HofQ